MYVIFLGIVPLMSLCALLSFYYRQNPVLFKRKITSTKLSYVPNKQKIYNFCTCTCLSSICLKTAQTPANNSVTTTISSCLNILLKNNLNENDVVENISGVKNLEIKSAGLVSTTNPLILNRDDNSKILTIPRTSFQDKITYKFNHK